MDYTFISPILKIPALVGIIFFVIGIFMYIFPPKKINLLYGYRTKNSMKTQEHWDFSQKCAAIKMTKSGVWLLLISLTGFIIPFSIKNELIIGISFVFILSAYLIINTEKAIKSKFESSGK